MKINSLKNKLKQRKGITLISLVITIIVLLILAGVAIATLNGQNGVLNRASEARVADTVGSFKEQASMAQLSAKTSIASKSASESGYIATYNGTGANAKNYFTQLAEEVASGLGVTAIKGEAGTTAKIATEGYTVAYYLDIEGNTSTNGNGYIVIWYTNNGLRASMGDREEAIIRYNLIDTEPTQTSINQAVLVTVIKVDNYDCSLATNVGLTSTTDGEKDLKVATIENTTLAGDFVFSTADSTAKFGKANSEYIDSFGKKVTGTSVPTAGSNWRLFYADSNYAYLISDSIGNYALGNTSIVKGWGISTISTLAKNFNSNYTANGDWTLKSDGININNNIKAVAALLDTSKWENYKSSDAEWAIGAPTVEMFIESYNATHSSTKATTLGVSNHQIACSVNKETQKWTGYRISIDNSSPNTYIVGLGNTSNLDKAIYCPSSEYYWLASPSDGDRDLMMLVSSNSNGALGGISYNNTYGIRPLVCIPISKIENGITITENY